MSSTAARHFDNANSSTACAARRPAVSTRLATVPGGLFILGILILVLALVLLGALNSRLGG